MKRHEVTPVANGWQRGGILFGCDYNPEQWPEEVWLDDVRLMVEAGVDLVAINIFGWASLEPRPGEYDFAALDRVIALLHEHGIRINLGTGTSSPPPWLSTLHPEILPVAVDGTTRWPGGRQAWCPSSPVFRERALALASAVAERYGSHPAIALWHVSNELGCHNALCYCDTSAEAFRRWLEAKYGSIDALNAAWGTTFWSQRYGAWREILPPRATLSAGNPAHALDFHRFSSDELLDHYRAELAIIRAVSTVPVTTNFMVTAHIRNMDYWRWAPEMDIVANDHYLDHRLPHPQHELAFAADLTRGLANGNPWMLMETSTSAVSWQPRNLPKQPGELARTAISHVARGADAVCFFQWRASRQGAEKFHSAILPHAGTDSRIWRESLELSRLLDRLDVVAGSTVEAEVALVFAWESWWAGGGPTHPTSALSHLTEAHRAYDALRASGVTVDIVPPGGDLSGYRVVVVPALYLARDADAAELERFVEAGGTAIVTYYSGVVDEDDRVRSDSSGASTPGAFSRLVGAWTEEFAPLAAGHAVRLSDGGVARDWTELLRPTTATVLAEYADGPLAGTPGIVSNEFGTGRAVWLGAALHEASYASLVATVLAEAGITGSGLGNEVEVITRSTDAERFTFVINHGAEPVTVEADGLELATGAEVLGALEVPAGAVRVVRSGR